jgi:hypothetical protein
MYVSHVDRFFFSGDHYSESDTLISLQGIKNLLKSELDERDMKVYYNVRLVGFSTASMSSDGGLQLALSFETNQRKVRWEANTSLMYGNLLCLSPGGRFNQAGPHFS